MLSPRLYFAGGRGDGSGEADLFLFDILVFVYVKKQMGTCLSTSEKPEPDRDLEARLLRLEHNADRNADGKISQQELSTWWNEQQLLFRETKKELETELQIVKEQLRKARQELEQLQQPPREEAERTEDLILSNARIEEFVASLLDDETVNISWIPDVVERQLYFNVFNLLLRVLSDVLDESSVSFIGHQLQVRVRAQAKPTKATGKATRSL